MYISLLKRMSVTCLNNQSANRVLCCCTQGHPQWHPQWDEFPVCDTKRLLAFKCEIKLDLEPFWDADGKLAHRHREYSRYVCFKVMTAASCRVVSNNNSQSFTSKCIILRCGGYTLNWIDVCLGLICTLVRAVNSNHRLEEDKRCLLPPRGLQGYIALLVYSSISKTSRMFSTSRPAVGTPSPFYFFFSQFTSDWCGEMHPIVYDGLTEGAGLRSEVPLRQGLIFLSVPKGICSVYACTTGKWPVTQTSLNLNSSIAPVSVMILQLRLIGII